VDDRKPHRQKARIPRGRPPTTFYRAAGCALFFAFGSFGGSPGGRGGFAGSGLTTVSISLEASSFAGDAFSGVGGGDGLIDFENGVSVSAVSAEGSVWSASPTC
jgi:hypothetical protein